MPLKVESATKSGRKAIVKYFLILLLVLYFAFMFCFPLQAAGFHAQIYMAARNGGLNAKLVDVEYCGPMGEYCAYFKLPNGETTNIMLGGGWPYGIRYDQLHPGG